MNKVNTKAQLRWPVLKSNALPPAIHGRFLKKHGHRLTKSGDLIITSQRFRDQGRNVADCLAKLRLMVLSIVEPPKTRKKTKPTRGSKLRKRKNKEALSQKKQSRKPPNPGD